MDAVHQTDVLMSMFLNLIPSSVYGEGKPMGLTDGGDDSTSKVRTRKKRNKQRRAGTPGASDSGPSTGEAATTPRDRLNAKLLELRSARKADDPRAQAQRNAKKRRKDEKGADQAEKRQKVKGNKQKGNTAKPASAEDDTKGNEANEVYEGGVADADSLATVGKPQLEVGRVEGFDDDHQDQGHEKRRRKGRNQNLKRLEHALDAATKDAEARQTAEMGGESDEREAVRQREMQKALERAKGESVKDDVAKIKKSIRKEKRKKEKSKEDWQKRVASVAKDKQARQEKREEHLRERKQSKDTPRTKRPKASTKPK